MSNLLPFIDFYPLIKSESFTYDILSFHMWCLITRKGK